MSEHEEAADDELSGPEAPGEEADSDEFVVRALERAQSVARTHGYTRSTLPSWGLDETRPRRSLDGSSEYAAIETDGFGRLADEESVAARAAARAAAEAGSKPRPRRRRRTPRATSRPCARP